MDVHAAPLPNFQDANLQACVDEHALLNGWAQAEEVTQLNCAGREIQFIHGIDQLPNLTALDLDNNLIEDLVPLSFETLPTTLTELRLANNRISEVHWLSDYRQLTVLWLSGNSGIDFNQLTPIVEQNDYLTELGLGGIALGFPDVPYFSFPVHPSPIVKLDLSDTGIEFLYGLNDYTALQWLDVSGNRIADLFPLAEPLLVENLRALYLADNRIYDVSPLSAYQDLTALWLSGNTAIDFNLLEPIIEQNDHLTELGLGGIALDLPDIPSFSFPQWPYPIVKLDLSETGIEDLFGLTDYTALQWLDVSGNRIADLFPLQEPLLAESLRSLYLADNQIDDVSALSAYQDLTALWLSGNSGVDLNQLEPIIAQNAELAELGLGGIALNQLDIPAFSFPELPYPIVKLDLSDTGIENLSGLEDYANLNWLDVSGNHIADLRPLQESSFAENLRALYLADNLIDDVSALSAYQGLTALWLSGNSGIYFNQLEPIVEQNDYLTELGLGGIALGFSDVPYFSFSVHPSPIVKLDLSATGIEFLYGLIDYARLQWLDVSGNHISDLFPLQDPLLVENLRALYLADNQIDDVSPLNAYQDLTALWLSGNNGVDFNQLEPIIEQNNYLVELGLGGIALKYGDVPHFSFPVWPYPIVRMDLSNTGLETLYGIEVYTRLQWFNAADNQLVEVLALLDMADLSLADLSGNTEIPCEQLNQLDSGLGSGVVQHPATCDNGAPPSITLIEPADGFVAVEGQVVHLNAAAFDPEDGDLTASVEWSSSLHGALGTGGVLDVALLPGEQTLTASITDSHGNSTTAAVAVSVLANTAPDLDLQAPVDGFEIELYLPLTLTAVASDVEDGDLSGEIQWSSDTSGTLGVGETLTVTLAVGTHVITATVQDSGGKSHSLSRTVIVNEPPMFSYCNGAGADASRSWIDAITLGDVSNVSGSQGGYGDFTGFGPIYLERGANLVSLVPGFVRGERDVSWAVYVDLNRDGVFGAGEQLLSTRVAGVISGSLTIPDTAASGATRLRVVMSRAPNTHPCKRFREGEVEDYSIVLLP